MIIGACHAPPELPSIPFIEFKKVEIKSGGETTDSLNIYLYFEDGDGDLGLAVWDTLPPFNPINYLFDASGNPITYANRRPEDPPFNSQTNNIYWQILSSGSGDNFRADTFRIELNPNHKNFFLRIYSKPAGTDQPYEEFDLLEEFGLSLDSRFPYLNTTDKNRPLQGELKYGLNTRGLNNTDLRFDSVKFEIWIQDRALNESNRVFTPPFTFKDITVD
ncbi:hypothetical protein PEDI_05840 [Persicobacter diffluens]|uniref:Uncharacterized protein n=2 Tax=Persicobacter TaxID=59740 RepID=A0AAN4VW38_9BACT|nr:hypothetical protein PEDI_05840 [Persicobacter diffluens]